MQKLPLPCLRLPGRVCKAFELTQPADPDLVPASTAAGTAGLVVANSSLLVAALVYMGWAYTEALYGYFHVSPLDLGIGIPEYVLRSLSLFSPAIVIAAVAFIAVMAVRAWPLDLAKLVAFAGRAMAPAMRIFPWQVSAGAAQRLRAGRTLLMITGTAVTASALALAGLAGHVYISTYLLLVLLGGGPLILTWPARAARRGRLPYALAIIVAAVCALWGGSVYARDLGIRAAQNVVSGLPARTAAAVYSVRPLALSGPGVTVQHLRKTFRYHYRYQGLRLLIERSGTYYLLPVGWNPRFELTYILDDSDQIRIDLYSGERPAS